MKISYGKNVYDHQEINAVVSQLKKTTQMGKSVSRFEDQISKKFSKKYGLMVNSGSSAITLALKVLSLKPRDEVIVPCLNFGTAISSLINLNLLPIFVDIEIETLQIKIDEIEKKITNKTKAIMVPNLIGNIPNWKKIKKIAKKYKLKVIEDSADTLGAKIGKNSTGLYSDISITSFYGSHVISCAGNGGMLLTNERKYYEKAKVLRSWGRLSTLVKDSENINKRLAIKLKGVNYDKKFVFSESGYNFEPSEIGAAFGLVQLKKFKKFSGLRNFNFDYHKKKIEKLKDFFITPKILKGISTNFLAFPLIIKDLKILDRKKLQIFLENNHIQTRPIFSGNILRHPAFYHLVSKRNKIENFPNSDFIMKHGLLIGCHQGLKKNNLNFIHKKLSLFLLKQKKTIKL